ncbi:uncharacterized protein EI90DRAFT_2905513 [Cantharellus anzutake]|uniref:uncharacterized protein n=1 Tax=Cantharellus anzutake TaxID=1750568 RepID=UPI00190844D8|nr:uncharacterized protein EI90DRAFT_2905513 [Cantharellus anzutake]KAF8341482.1 hypothetical protein EI90DRAFT_2905513 [Cantharellus anzutake]
MCWPGESKWKREIVNDHKFDFVDVHDYHSESWGTRLQYLWLYLVLIKSFLVYLSDLYTAVTMLTTSGWSNGIFQKCKDSQIADNCVVVDFTVGKWIFVGCIIFGYLLLLYEGWKAQKIIVSRDISYAFTNVLANTHYSLKSYDTFCFFTQIENSTKKKDDFAFFVFFTFKGWKRLILSDGPRQCINALTLYSFWLVNSGSLKNMENYWLQQSLVTKFLLISILFTVVVFLCSLFLLIVAALCYVPLLCYIQGNLKEYCCHKVDKRIAELMKRKNRARIARIAKLARKEAAGDFSHLKDKNGEQIRKPIPQPTLPNIKLDEEDTAATSAYRNPGGKSNYASSYATTKDDYGAYPDYPPTDYPPPMPVYDDTYYYQHPSLKGTGEYDDSMYEHDIKTPGTEYGGSTTHLAQGQPGPRFSAQQRQSHDHLVEAGQNSRHASNNEWFTYERGDVEVTAGPSPHHRRSKSGSKQQGGQPSGARTLSNGRGSGLAI